MESGVIIYNMPLTDISDDNLLLVLETRMRIEGLRQQNGMLLAKLKDANVRGDVLEKRLDRIATASIVALYGIVTAAAIFLQKGCAQ